MGIVAFAPQFAYANRGAKLLLACMLTLMLMAVAGGCGGDPGMAVIRTPVDTSGHPALTSIGPVNLDEQPGATLGAVTTFFTVTPAGQVIIGDMSAKRVLAFGPRGKYLSEVGGSGSGPGEFQVPGVIGVDPLGRLFINDVGQRKISLFAGAEDSLVSEFSVDFSGLGLGYAAWGDTLILPLQASTKPFAKWVLRSDSAAAFGIDPLRKPGSGSVLMSYGIPGIARVGDSIIAWRPGAAGIELFSRSGIASGVVSVPRSRRSGEFADLVTAQQTAWKRDKGSMIGSLMVGISKLPNGEVVLASLDQDGELQPTGRVQFRNYQLYITLVAPDLKTACVDAEVPISSDVPPVPIFRGDTLLVLIRKVAADDRIRTAVERFRVSDSGCIWHPTSKQ